MNTMSTGMSQCTCRAVLHLSPSQSCLTSPSSVLGHRAWDLGIPSWRNGISAKARAPRAGTAEGPAAGRAQKCGDQGFPTLLGNLESAGEMGCQKCALSSPWGRLQCQHRGQGQQPREALWDGYWMVFATPQAAFCVNSSTPWMCMICFYLPGRVAMISGSGAGKPLPVSHHLHCLCSCLLSPLGYFIAQNRI